MNAGANAVEYEIKLDKISDKGKKKKKDKNSNTLRKK